MNRTGSADASFFHSCSVRLQRMRLGGACTGLVATCSSHMSTTVSGVESGVVAVCADVFGAPQQRAAHCHAQQLPSQRCQLHSSDIMYTCRDGDLSTERIRFALADEHIMCAKCKTLPDVWGCPRPTRPGSAPPDSSASPPPMSTAGEHIRPLTKCLARLSTQQRFHMLASHHLCRRTCVQICCGGITCVRGPGKGAAAGTGASGVVPTLSTVDRRGAAAAPPAACPAALAAPASAGAAAAALPPVLAPAKVRPTALLAGVRGPCNSF